MASGKAIVGGASGLTAASWSTDGETSDLGAVLNVRVLNTADREDVPHASGETVGFLLYNVRDELEIEIACLPNASIPAPGAAITIGGVAGKVMSAEKVRTYKQWTKIKVNATNFHALGS